MYKNSPLPKRMLSTLRNVSVVMALTASQAMHAAPPPNPNPDNLPIPIGRLAFSNDGNAHDEDDWGALAFEGALPWAAGVSDRIVHIDYNNHIASTDNNWDQEMIDSANGIVSRFDVDPNALFNALTELNAATNNFVQEAQASSASDPLWYFCAGPMEVPWRMLNAVKNQAPNKLQYIHLVSHSNWNETHVHGSSMTHTWASMKNDFPEATFHDILDQNNSDGDNDWSTPRSEWTWLENSPYEPYRWVHGRDGFAPPHPKNKFDPSDAGMLYWWLSGGPNGGDQRSGWPEAKSLLEGALQGGVSQGTYGNNGNPWSIGSGTTRIELENYDIGGQGVAYSDTTSANLQNGIRQNEGVDNRVTNDSAGGGYTIGYTENGEWLEYTVNVSAGSYDIKLRSANGSGSPGNVEVLIGDGSSFSALHTFNVQNTGGWSNYTTLTANSISLSGGQQVLRLNLGGGTNLNWIEFTKVTTGGGGASFTEDNGLVSIEAENYDQQLSGVGSASGSQWNLISEGGASSGESMQAQPNTGVNVGDTEDGPYFDYSIDFNSTGTWYAWIRTKSSTNVDDSIHLGLNGVPTTYGAAGMGLNTGSYVWQNKLTNGTVVTFNVPSAGVHTLNLWMREDGVIMDKIVLSKSSSFTPSGTGPAETTGLGGSSDVGAWIQGTAFDAESHPGDDNNINGGGTTISYIRENNWVRYDNFNFGSGASSFTVEGASDGAGGTVELRLGSLTGTLIGSVVIPNSGSWSSYQNYTTNSITGESNDDLYLVFKKNGSSSGATYLFNVRDIRFD